MGLELVESIKDLPIVIKFLDKHPPKKKTNKNNVC